MYTNNSDLSSTYCQNDPQKQPTSPVRAEDASDPLDVSVLPVRFRRFSEIESKPIRWLWRDKIPRGKVSMLAGNPGLGKSQVTASMAAVVSSGGKWPVDMSESEPGSVILFSAEDDAADTIRPRLEAAGADLDRVFILDAVVDDKGNRQRAFNLAIDLPRLEALLEYVGDVALIVIDPVTAYLGGVDSHKNADIRALLSPLADLAAKYDAAVICVSHLNKATGSQALLRVMGSLAFVAAARTAFVVERDKNDTDRRLLLPLKSNVANDASGVAFSIEPLTLERGIETSRVKWEDEPVSITADEAMFADGDLAGRSAVQEAKDFLQVLLSDGPVLAETVKAEAENAGISGASIRRAEKIIGVQKKKDGMRGAWQWHLPPKMFNDPEDVQQVKVSTFGEDEHLRGCASQGGLTIFQNGDVPELTEDDLLTAGWL